MVSDIQTTVATLAQQGISVIEYLIKWENRYKYYSIFYKFFYYFSRTITCLCAAILPFIIGKQTFIIWSTMGSIIIAVMVALDIVFNPKDNWKKYSKSYTDLELKRVVKKNATKEQLEGLQIIHMTENGKEDLISMEEILNTINKVNKRGG